MLPGGGGTSHVQPRGLTRYQVTEAQFHPYVRSDTIPGDGGTVSSQRTRSDTIPGDVQPGDVQPGDVGVGVLLCTDQMAAFKPNRRIGVCAVC